MRERVGGLGTADRRAMRQDGEFTCRGSLGATVRRGVRWKFDGARRTRTTGRADRGGAWLIRQDGRSTRGMSVVATMGRGVRCSSAVHAVEVGAGVRRAETVRSDRAAHRARLLRDAADALEANPRRLHDYLVGRQGS